MNSPSSVGKAKHWRAALIAILCGVTAATLFVTLTSRKPAYQGKRLPEWIAGIETWPPPPDRKEAERALLAMGTNAVPHLLQMWCARDSDWAIKVRRLLTRKHLLNCLPTETQRRATRALIALHFLASKGILTASDILPLLERGDAPAHDAGELLVGMGETNIRPVLEWGYSTNARLRLTAISALSGVAGLVSTNMEPQVANFLQRALAGSDRRLRAAAEETLVAWADARNDPQFLRRGTTTWR